MLQPLEQFICDTCGELINTPTEGTLEWIEYTNPATGTYEIHSFNIVHHFSASPRNNRRAGCYQHDNAPGRSDLGLENFTPGNYQMPNILRFLDPGAYHMPTFAGPFLTDMRQFVDTVRRLTIPHFEEARLHWNDALADGYFSTANEIWIYLPENLRELIVKYGHPL